MKIVKMNEGMALRINLLKVARATGRTYSSSVNLVQTEMNESYITFDFLVERDFSLPGYPKVTMKTQWDTVRELLIKNGIEVLEDDPTQWDSKVTLSTREENLNDQLTSLQRTLAFFFPQTFHVERLISNEKKKRIIRDLENKIEGMGQDHEWAHSPSYEVARQEEVDSVYHKLNDVLNSVRYDRSLLRTDASQTTRNAYPEVSEAMWLEAEGFL